MRDACRGIAHTALVDAPLSATAMTALDVARACAEAAGEVIRAGFGRTGVAAVKGRGNVVTEVDFEAERRVMGVLRREYPAHTILSEETAAATRSSDWMWVVDPLDGTKNFAHGIPHFAFSIALCHDSDPVVALTTHPLLQEEFAAVRGMGATLAGKAASVTSTATVRESVVGIDLGYDDARGVQQLALASRLFPGVQAIRAMGSAALGFAFVAAGRLDAYVHSDLQPWDIAAGLLLVREAGGLVTDRGGAPATLATRAAIAGGHAVHRELVGITRDLPVE